MKLMLGVTAGLFLGAVLVDLARRWTDPGIRAAWHLSIMEGLRGLAEAVGHAALQAEARYWAAIEETR